MANAGIAFGAVGNGVAAFIRGTVGIGDLLRESEPQFLGGR